MYKRQILCPAYYPASCILGSAILNPGCSNLDAGLGLPNRLNYHPPPPNFGSVPPRGRIQILCQNLQLSPFCMVEGPQTVSKPTTVIIFVGFGIPNCVKTYNCHPVWLLPTPGTHPVTLTWAWFQDPARGETHHVTHSKPGSQQASSR